MAVLVTFKAFGGRHQPHVFVCSIIVRMFNKMNRKRELQIVAAPRNIVGVFLLSASFTVVESFNLWRFSWKLFKHRMEQLHRQSDYVRFGT